MSANDIDAAPLVEVAFNDLTFHECIGGGTFGSVYRAHWISQDREVAVKKVLSLGKEAQVLSCLSHRHIIKFYGAATIAPNYCLITEYAALGSLYSHLADPANVVEFRQIVTWACHVASGINYLHNEAAVKVIHRDLKSKNCVICDNMTVKLVDFGASRFHGSTAVMTMAGTFPWMAPEVILGEPVSEKCDTFSYGVVLWELLTREVPFKGVEGIQVAWAVVEKNERLKIPSTCPDKLTKLILPCWEREPTKRPSFKEIIKMLDHLINDEPLSVETGTFLRQKEKWKTEIDEMMANLRLMERQLTEKENKLDNRENHLRHLEDALANQVVVPFGVDAKHDANYWSEQEVYLWVLQLQTTGSNRNDLAQYAPLMLEHNITGRRLLLLSMDDLLALGIKSLGHRKDLLVEIEKLKLENYRLQHFPPLSSVKSIPSSPTKTSANRPRNLHLTLIFGNLCRSGPSPEEFKWKVYVETDCEDGSLRCIRDVTLCVMDEPGVKETLRHSPYIMTSWKSARRGREPRVECTVAYKDCIKKPKSTSHIHQVTWRDAANHTAERKIKLTGTLPSKASSPHPSSYDSYSSENLGGSTTGSSIGTLQGWSRRVLQNSVDPALYETVGGTGSTVVQDKNPALWSAVVSGKITNKASLSPSPEVKSPTPTQDSQGSSPSTKSNASTLQWPVRKHHSTGTSPTLPSGVQLMPAVVRSQYESDDDSSSTGYQTANSTLSTPSPEVWYRKDYRQFDRSPRVCGDVPTRPKTASPHVTNDKWLYPRPRSMSGGGQTYRHRPTALRGQRQTSSTRQNSSQGTSQGEVKATRESSENTTVDVKVTNRGQTGTTRGRQRKSWGGPPLFKDGF